MCFPYFNDLLFGTSCTIFTITSNTNENKFSNLKLMLILFVANMGGLLGLFMGFSAFSIIEICYFLSIRPGCNYMRRTVKRQKAIRRMNHIRTRGAVKNINNITRFPRLD